MSGTFPAHSRFVAAQVQRHSGFIHRFHNAKPRECRDVIIGASLSEINTLLKVIRSVLIGDIPISRTDFNSIVRKKRLPALRRNFETKKAFKALMSKDRIAKQRVLFNLQSVIPCIIKEMFE